MKKKINPIPKTLRERKRYFKLNVTNKNKDDVKKIIYDEAQNFYGINGFAKIGLMFVKDHKDLVKINKDFVDEFLIVLNYINLKYSGLKIEATKVSGTIDGLDDVKCQKKEKKVTQK